MGALVLTKIDVRAILKGHIASLRDYGTGKRSKGDALLFVGVPSILAGVAAWRGLHLHLVAINGLLTAYSIFVGLLFNLVLLVITFLERTQGSPTDSALHARKQLLREITANVSFSILGALVMVAIAIVALILAKDDKDSTGTAVTVVLVAGSANFLLNLLMILKRMYALVTNEFDRHKLQKNSPSQAA